MSMVYGESSFKEEMSMVYFLCLVKVSFRSSHVCISVVN